MTIWLWIPLAVVAYVAFALFAAAFIRFGGAGQ